MSTPLFRGFPAFAGSLRHERYRQPVVRVRFALDREMANKENNPMRDEELLNVLEDAAARLQIKLDYEDLKKGEVATHGGLFVLRGEKRILIHKGLCVRDRVCVLLEILSGLDTESVHLPPDVRERLEAMRRN